MLEDFNLPGVPVVQSVTAADFARDILPKGLPVLFKGLVADWQSVRRAKSSSLDLAGYIKSLDNGVPTTVLEASPNVKGHLAYGPDMRDFNFNRRTRPISAAVDQLVDLISHSNPPYIYIQSTPTPDHLPGFVAENPNPLLPPAIAPRIWISNATRAQTHNDFDHNIACVVGGRRRFTLFPPDQLANLYIGPLDHTPSGRAISLASLEEPDFARFPRLKDAIATAMVAEMEPGDALYVPKYWWHHVQSLTPFNVLVNYWWGNSANTLDNPMAAFLAGLLSIKNLSAQDMTYWKAMFDHYIFQTDGDPTGHIPKSIQGGLGPLTPQSRAELIKALQKMASGKP